MATLKNIFDKCGVALYQNESLDLDHYYQEPYQDEGDEIKVIGEPFETDKSKKIRPYDLFAEDRTFSNFSFFMDGSRRTYKIEQFREILPYYLIKYNGKKDQMGDGAVQLSLMDDSDIVFEDQ